MDKVKILWKLILSIAEHDEEFCIETLYDSKEIVQKQILAAITNNKPEQILTIINNFDVIDVKTQCPYLPVPLSWRDYILAISSYVMGM